MMVMMRMIFSSLLFHMYETKQSVILNRTFNNTAVALNRHNNSRKLKQTTNTVQVRMLLKKKTQRPCVCLKTINNPKLILHGLCQGAQLFYFWKIVWFACVEIHPHAPSCLFVWKTINNPKLHDALARLQQRVPPCWTKFNCDEVLNNRGGW